MSQCREPTGQKDRARRFVIGRAWTHIVALSKIQIVEHVIGHSIGDVVPIDVQTDEHDAHPELKTQLEMASYHKPEPEPEPEPELEAGNRGDWKPGAIIP